MRQGRRHFLLASAGLLLGACGGGTDDDGAAPQEQQLARAQGEAASANRSARGKSNKRRARAYARKGVTAIAVSGDGTKVGVAHADGRVRLLDGAGSADKRLLKPRGGAPVAGLVFSAEGRYLVAVGVEQCHREWLGDRVARRGVGRYAALPFFAD